MCQGNNGKNVTFVRPCVNRCSKHHFGTSCCRVERGDVTLWEQPAASRVRTLASSVVEFVSVCLVSITTDSSFIQHLRRSRSPYPADAVVVSSILGWLDPYQRLP